MGITFRAYEHSRPLPRACNPSKAFNQSYLEHEDPIRGSGTWLSLQRIAGLEFEEVCLFKFKTGDRLKDWELVFQRFRFDLSLAFTSRANHRERDRKTPMNPRYVCRLANHHPCEPRESDFGTGREQGQCDSGLDKYSSSVWDDCLGVKGSLDLLFSFETSCLENLLGAQRACGQVQIVPVIKNVRVRR